MSKAEARKVLEPYVAPTGDESPDAIQLAVVRLCVTLIVAEIRDELAAEACGDATQEPSSCRQNHAPVPTPTRRRAG